MEKFNISVYEDVELLFSSLAKIVANQYGFEYPQKSEEFVISYLEHVFK